MNDVEWEIEKERIRALPANHGHRSGESWYYSCPYPKWCCTWGYPGWGMSGGVRKERGDEGNLDHLRNSVENHLFEQHDIEYSEGQRCTEEAIVATTSASAHSVQCRLRVKHWEAWHTYKGKHLQIKWS